MLSVLSVYSVLRKHHHYPIRQHKCLQTQMGKLTSSRSQGEACAGLSCLHHPSAPATTPNCLPTV